MILHLISIVAISGFAISGAFLRVFLRTTILLGSLLALSPPIEAASIRGFISIQSSRVFLRPVIEGVRRPAPPLSIATSIGIRSSLLDLKTGDYVVVSGQFRDSNLDGRIDEVFVQAIESVGLKDLIGTWQSENSEFVRFEDFTRMSFYRPRGTSELAIRGRHLNLAKTKDLNYTLAPEQGSSYSIFLFEKASGGRPAPVYVGRLDVKRNALRLEIYHPQTGGSWEVLSLLPVRD